MLLEAVLPLFLCFLEKKIYPSLFEEEPLGCLG
jgi:hypothetical protein